MRVAAQAMCAVMRSSTAVLLLIVLRCAPSHGATLNVPSEYPTIQAAVDVAASYGDRILVDGGEYLEDVLVLRKCVDIVSQHGAAETTVSSISYMSPEWPMCGGSVVGFRVKGNLSAGEVCSFLLRRCEVLGWVDIWETMGPSCTVVEVDSCFVRSGLGVVNRYETEVSDCVVTGNGIGVDSAYDAYVTRCIVRSGGVWSSSCDLCSISSCVLTAGSVRVEARSIGLLRDNVLTSGNVEVGVWAVSGHGVASVVGNTILNGGIMVRSEADCEGEVYGNTIFGYAGDGIRCEVYSGGPFNLSRNVVASCHRGIVWNAPLQSTDLVCNDVWQNSGGNWIGVPGAAVLDGNISLDPQFCDPAAGNLMLAADSPCLPGNPGNGDCGQIGALGRGCDYPSVVPDGPVAAMPFLARPAPNPFSKETTLSYGLPTLSRSARVRLDVVDASGRIVRGLVDEVEGPGTRRMRWNGMDDRGGALPSGIYWCRLRIDDWQTCARLVRVQ